MDFLRESSEREMELVAMLCEKCETPAEVTAKLKTLFVSTLEKGSADYITMS